ncbi:MAG TPA: heavy metal-responsive transcriptional regulator [Vicinamibacterales bacterium]|nr:heavy metal-responsive transcriptional regulator [Vicinamibacterales bacterium]
MQIGEVARRAGVSPDTIRHYERRGLLPRSPRTAGGFRLYGPEAVRRVALVRRALAFGFSLGELQVFLARRDSGGRPCRDVRAAAEAKLEAVEMQLAELRKLRTSMRQALSRWDATLDGADERTPVRLLDDLPDVSPRASRQPRRSRT